MKSFIEHIREAEEWRGPHEGKEFDLMMAGHKPMTLLIQSSEDGKYKKFTPHIKSGRFIEHRFKFHTGHGGIVVGQPGQEKNMARLGEIMSSTKRPHREIGRLLGYKEEHIQKFVDERGEG